MVTRATYAVIGDLHAILPAIIAEVRAARYGRRPVTSRCRAACASISPASSSQSVHSWPDARTYALTAVPTVGKTSASGRSVSAP